MACNFIVVGDRFENFAQLDQCICFSELQVMLATDELINKIESGNRYYPGQGILAEQIHTFIESIEAKGISGYFDAWYYASAHFKAGKKLTHKHKAANGLVTDPKRLYSNTFELDISVDGNNEIISDHESGFHLQGMLLIETARQSILAVTNKFFLPEVAPHHRYFVFQHFSIDFLSFAFPVDAKIVYKIIDSDTTKPLRSSFTARIEIHQGNVVVSSVNTTYSVYQKHVIERKEHYMAKKCLTHHLEDCLSNEPQFEEAVNS